VKILSVEKAAMKMHSEDWGLWKGEGHSKLEAEPEQRYTQPPIWLDLPWYGAELYHVPVIKAEWSYQEEIPLHLAISDPTQWPKNQKIPRTGFGEISHR
jgi:hypothetical protein